MGDREFFYGREFEVVGVLEPTGLGIDDSGFVTLDTVYDLASSSIRNPLVTRKLDVEPGQISALMVKVNGDYSRSDVANRIQKAIPDIGIVTSQEVMSTAVASQLESLTPVFIVIAAGFWLISILMIGALFSMSVNERRRELGLLQALGASRRFIFKEVMAESIELTTLGGIAGLAIGAVIILFLRGTITSSLKIAYLWPSSEFFASFMLGYMGLAVFTGILAALYPALIASRLEPYQAIRSGE